MRSNRLLIVLTVLLAAATFVVDLLVPFGVADAVPYMIVVWASLSFSQRRAPPVTAAICTGLTFLGAALTFPSDDSALGYFIANRLLALLAIWLTAFLGWTRRRVEEEQKSVGAALDRQMQVQICELARANAALQAEAQQRRRSEAAQSRLASILERAPNFVVIATADGRVIYVNEALRKAAGLDGPDPAAGLTIADIHPPDVAARVSGGILPATSRDGSWTGELTVRGAGETEIPVIADVLAHRASDGTVEYWSFISRDISEQKRATAALRASEARIRAIFEAALDCILIMDRAGRIVEFNKAAERTFGYKRDEVLGREMAELLVSPASRERHRSNIDRYASGGEGSLLGKRLEQPVIRKDGEEFIAEMAMQPIVVEGPPVFAVYLRDVTARRRAEQALRDSEALYHSLVETLPLCVLRKDAAGRFTFANKAFCELSGKTPDEVVGKTDFDLYPPELARKYRQDDQRVLATGELFEDVEGHKEADGEQRFVQVLKTPVKDADGRRIGTQLFFWDVTDRKRAEQKLERLAAELALRNAELKQSAEEIRFKNRDLETLLYVTSHDLREPLRAIENFSRIVHDRYAAQLDEKGQDFLQRVVRGAQRMDRLLEDVLTLSRAQRTMQPNAEVDAADVVADVLRQLEPKIRDTGASVRVATGLPHLRVDRAWVTQAVYNLVINALKFTRPGEPPDVEIAAYCNGQEGPAIAVRDRGPGVAPEHAERIFQLFQRAVGREVEGTGAGLAIVRQVAERHGGRAWVQPRPEGGSEFVISFGPVKPP